MGYQGPAGGQRNLDGKWDEIVREKALETKIKEAILKRSGYVIKNQASSTTGRGKPDLSACVNGKYWGIEVKAPQGSVKTTHVQVLNLQRIAAAGGIAVYAKTANLFNPEDYTISKEKFDEKRINLLLNQEDVKIIKFGRNVIYIYKETKCN